MKKYTYISLFSSAGVGCYGFKEENFECIATNELLEKRLQIQKYNNKCKYSTGYIVGDIQKQETQNAIFSQIDLWKKKEKLKEVDVLVATPPCQGMSVANHKKKDESTRNSLIVQSILLTLSIKPRYFVFENVRAFLKTLCITNDNKQIVINDFIDEQLSGDYNILKKVVNFKDYGSNSSRTRTLVVGVRKDIKDITPFDIFPKVTQEKTLLEVIGNFKSLKNMGEIDESDIYHSFRKYDKKMLPWVTNTKEGTSAFSNKKVEHRPHRISNGKIVINVEKNGDKYSRCSWNKVGPCIHTRNDILASQSTIHPKDDRVFSVRELMSLMTIPEKFNWSNLDLGKLNSLTLKEKEEFIKKEDINIRQSIGEAVPTAIFKQIAQNIKTAENACIDSCKVKNMLNENSFNSLDDIKEFLLNKKNKFTYTAFVKAIEFLNTNRENNAAFYTPQNICYDVVKELPDFNKDTVSVLEPSVGAGNFIPLIIKKYEDKNLLLDIIDIDGNILELTNLLIKRSCFAKNVKINILNVDFLTYETSKRYDVIVGNPPFGKVSNAELLEKYKANIYNKNTSNIFAFFLEKSIKLADFVSFITPKSLLSSPEYNLSREFIEHTCQIKSIIDFGENGFDGVKIETIALSLINKKTKNPYNIKIESMITKSVSRILNTFMFDKDLCGWLIYKDVFFENIKQSLFLGIFNSFRDRQITKKHIKDNGKYRVLKSRNIASNNIVEIDGYDAYLEDISAFSVKKYLNSKSVLVPNLTYNPRACFMPKNCIADGSVAILQAKNGYLITENDLEYFASDEFKKFYMIGRNLGSRSLNIDSNSVNLWGIKKERHYDEHK